MKLMERLLKVFLVVVLSVQMVSCGTILYPERRGQKSGRIDTGVAVLDGIGLLFFLVPGIIAYAVDFSTGAIYLPEETSMIPSEGNGIRKIKFDPAVMTPEVLGKVIREETGYDIDLDDPNLQTTTLESYEEMEERFSHFLKSD